MRTLIILLQKANLYVHKDVINIITEKLNTADKCMLILCICPKFNISILYKYGYIWIRLNIHYYSNGWKIKISIYQRRT